MVGRKNSSHRDLNTGDLLTYLDKLLNGFCDVSVELFDLNCSQVHVAEEAVDDLEERLLHAGKTLV